MELSTRFNELLSNVTSLTDLFADFINSDEFSSISDADMDSICTMYLRLQESESILLGEK